MGPWLFSPIRLRRLWDFRLIDHKSKTVGIQSLAASAVRNRRVIRSPQILRVPEEAPIRLYGETDNGGSKPETPLPLTNRASVHFAAIGGADFTQRKPR